MSAAQQAQSATTWTEPPWSGWIETTGDALLILEAARRGLIPRVTRRLVDSERKMITSGSVFVFDEDESGIKRWTDGFYWSPSRILGNFLLYRETDKRGAGHRTARGEQDTQDAPAAATSFAADGVQTLSRPKTDNAGLSVDKQRERTLMGSLTNSYKFKPDGLMKKTFSVTIGGVAQHLISYYKIEDVENGRLRSPSSLPELASLDISPEYLDKTHFRNPPKVEIGVDGVPRYRGEADDIENSPSILTAPLSSGMPLLTEGRLTDPSLANRRGKRYEPYGSLPATKRPRRNTGAGNGASTSTAHQDGGSSSSSSEGTPTADPVSPQESASSATPQPAAASIPPMTSVPAPPPPGAYPPPYGMHAFYPMPGYPPTHPPGAPPPGMYGAPAPPVGYGGTSAPVSAGGPGMHYTYAPYPPGAGPPVQETGAGSPQQQQAIAQHPVAAIQQAQAAPAPAQPMQQVHRTDPSQSAPAPPQAPGLPAPPPGQAQLPQPYYGYYHHPHGPPSQPGVGVNVGVPHHHNAMGVAPMMQGIQYTGYQPWPMYSGFPPQQPPHYAPQPPMMQAQAPVVQQPASMQASVPPTPQKREDPGIEAGGGKA